MDDIIGESDDNVNECEENGGTGGYGPTIMNLNENKAGMAGVDTNRVNKAIHEWSNGSNFQSYQTKRQNRIDSQIKEMTKRLKEMTEWQRIQCLRDADLWAKKFESVRDLTKIIVHIDLDMFFAAVEIKHRPHLADKPIAVGSDMMLSTSNYIARAFGIRPGMPGVLARRLCPQLILIKGDFKSYSKESKEVMKIMSELDPNLCCLSLDEAYIDLTEYVIDVYSHQNADFDPNSVKQMSELPQFLWDFAAQVVANIRQRILTETELSASAGIAPNSMIAKVCSDVNKPNGQHMVCGNMKEIEEFLVNTPVRKVCGIGPVRTQYLTALGVKTCKDLWLKRDIIRFCFTQFNAEYYLKVGLGIGSHILIREEEPQKSISSERTVGQITDFEAICDFLKVLSEELASDLCSKNQSCRTITLKLKKVSFEVSLKSQTLPFHTYDSETIQNAAKSLLRTEFSNTETNSRKYRLIGLKVSNLKSSDNQRNVSSSQLTLSQIFGSLKCDSKPNTTEDMSGSESSDWPKEHNQSNDYSMNSIYDSDLYECSVCSEKFEHKNVFESHENECIHQMLTRSATNEHQLSPDIPEWSDTASSALINTSSDLGIENSYQRKESEDLSGFLCPICLVRITLKEENDSNRQTNEHIDMCLNKRKCQELTQVPTASVSTPNQKMQKRVNSDTKVKDKSNKTRNSKKQKIHSISSQKTIDSFFRFK